jgi:transcriptional regulator with XRE-family HTH domain
MVTKVVPLNEAFDMMLKELNIKASRVCDRSGVSPSRLSQFRSGKGGDIGVRSLDALLIAAQSENSRAMSVFASYLGGIVKSIEDMTMAEKGELMMALGKSIQTSKNADSKSEKIA